MSSPEAKFKPSRYALPRLAGVLVAAGAVMASPCIASIEITAPTVVPPYGNVFCIGHRIESGGLIVSSVDCYSAEGVSGNVVAGVGNDVGMGGVPMVKVGSTMWVNSGSVTLSEPGWKTIWGKNDCDEVAQVDIAVVKVDNLTVAEPVGPSDPARLGLEPDSNPPTYWVCPCDMPTFVDVEAATIPVLEDDSLPGCFTFTGGQPYPTSKRKRFTESSTVLGGAVTFMASAGTSSRTVIVKSDDVNSRWDVDNAHGDCPCDDGTFGEGTSIDPNPIVDNCGNKLRINCVKCGFTCWNWVYLYQAPWESAIGGINVGTCLYSWGDNYFLYKTTKHKCRTVATWHLTREPGSPTRWTITKYDALHASGPTTACRTSNTWDLNWARPADEEWDGYPENSAENQGTPCP